jgi:hypothetical protein
VKSRENLERARRYSGLDTVLGRGPLAPVRNAPLVRLDSGVICESCGMHVDSTGQCRCSA